MVTGLVRSGAQPDEDVSHGDRGRIPVGELVVAGRHRPELLAAVHQPLHLIPGAITNPVKGRRPPAPGTPPGPVGLLVPGLGDGMGDAAGPQRRPVPPAGIGLVTGQVRHPGAGPPTTIRTGYPHGVHQPDELEGVGVLARGEAGGQVPAAAVADGVELGGQPAP
jgi:hypothetical protein